MNHPQNPYIAGNPVSDQDRFIGRADVMRETLRILRNPNTNAIVLHGQRRIGKTSILLRLEKDLMGDDYCPVYFDLQDKAASPLGDVLYQLAQTIAATLQIDVPNRTHFDHNGDFFRDQFLPSAAQQAAPRKVVLLFDEFDVLDLPQAGQAGSAFFPYLRAWMAQTLDVKFIFVLGRRPEELSTDTLATFKGTQSHQVSLISLDETLEIVRLAEKNQSLYWDEDALKKVWQWTQGHPYFTQLLCSEIWEASYDDEPAEPPTIIADDIEDAVPDALDQGANAFQWIWNGLPPAERIVMAAMAEENAETIGQHQLTELLNRSGVRLILRELELAPEILEKWDLLRRVKDDNQSDDQNAAYRFAIPLLKRWVKENKPLRRVKAELDSIEPLAIRLYQSAEDFYGLGDLENTEQLLNRALDVNPNHMQSRLLLGRVQLGKGNPAEAVAILEAVYAFDPSMARQDYVTSLMAVAEEETDVHKQLAFYSFILEIEPNQPVAQTAWITYWQQTASLSLMAENYEAAINAYQQIDDEKSIEHVVLLQRKAQLADLLKAAEEYEDAEQWSEAIDIYSQLAAEFPDEIVWQERLTSAREEDELALLYIQALGLIQEKKMEGVPTLLSQVISRRPDYKESARYLLLALQGDDIANLKQNLASVISERDTLSEKLQSIKEQNNTQKERIAILEKELAEYPRASQLAEKEFDRYSRASQLAVPPTPSPSQNTRDQEIDQKLAIWNPINHFRLLWWVLFDPKGFKKFRIALDSGQGIRLESFVNWNCGTLSWSVLSIYFAWCMVPSILLQESVIPIYIISFFLLFAWFLTGRYGHLNSDFIVAFAGALAGALAFIGVLAGALEFREEALTLIGEDGLYFIRIVVLLLAFATIPAFAGAKLFAFIPVLIFVFNIIFTSVFTFTWAVMLALALIGGLVIALAGAVTNTTAVALATAPALALVVAIAVITTGIGAIEISLIVAVWVILCLVVGTLEWFLCISVGLIAGIGCGGFIYWFDGQLSANSLIQSGTGIVIAIITGAIIFGIIIGVGNILEKSIEQA